MLNWLGVKSSYSPPRFIDDNTFSEALFRTATYRPEFPAQGFEILEQACACAAQFADWYNNDHLRYAIPQQRHPAQNKAILAARHALYLHAKGRSLGKVYKTSAPST